MPFRKSYKRGYPLALLVGLNKNYAYIWRIFSNVVKPEKTVSASGIESSPKNLYNFFEEIVDALRPAMKEGIRSVILTSAPRTNYSVDFKKHVKEHHAWLLQGATRVIFAEIVGSATSIHDVTELIRRTDFHRIVGETTQEDTESIISLLEKKLNSEKSEQLVLYSLDDIEKGLNNLWVVGKPKPEYIVITDTYNSTSREKRRLQRLQQIAANKGVKIRIISSQSVSGKRVSQLGGIICILHE